MLVYAKEPMGYLTIGGKRVYGKAYCYGRFGPTEITHKEYLHHREVLVEHPMTPDWLEKKFGKQFPPVDLVLEDMFRHMEVEVVIEIGKLLGVNYMRDARKKLKRSQTAALRRSIIRAIDSA